MECTNTEGAIEEDSQEMDKGNTGMLRFCKRCDFDEMFWK